MGNSAKNEVVKCIQEVSAKWSPHRIFSDWVTCLAVSIQNSCCLFHDKVWEQREQKYRSIMSEYGEAEQDCFSRMTAYLQLAMAEEITDILGEIYMESNSGNKLTGQFFTPFSVSELNAVLTIPTDYDGRTILNLHEPSSGAGGKIIAAASVLHHRGINYQRCLNVVAQDLDWLAVYMTYVQLSFYGINAIVVQGDTLTEPFAVNKPYPLERVMRTPRNMGALL